MATIKQLQVHIATFSNADLILNCFTGEVKAVFVVSP